MSSPLRRRLCLVAVAMAAVLAACGTRVDDEAMRAANGEVALPGSRPTAVGGGAVEPGAPAEPTVAPEPGPALQSPTAAGGRPQPGSASAPRPAGTAGARAGGAGPGPAGPKSEIVFGSFGVATGPLGALTSPIPVAAKAWAADVNARGGLNGHPVRIIFGDDGGDPNRALAIARRMVEQDGAVAFFATYAVTTMQAVTPYLEANNIPVIGASGGNEIEDHSPMIFNPQLGADYGTAWSYLIAIQEQTDKRKVAVLYCREASTCPNQVRRMEEYLPRTDGISFVYKAQMSIAQPDYTAEVIAARNAGAEIVLAVSDPPTMIRIVNSAKRQGWAPVFSATHSMNQESIKAGGKDVEGLLATASTVPYMTSPKLAPYLEAVRRYVPGGAVGGLGASAWAQGKLLERIASHLSDRPSREELLTGLYSLRAETLGGLVPPLTFPRGPHGNVNQCVVPLRFSGGKFVPKDGDRFFCPPRFVPGSGA